MVIYNIDLFGNYFINRKLVGTLKIIINNIICYIDVWRPDFFI